jgi:hypothetical protein
MIFKTVMMGIVIYRLVNTFLKRKNKEVNR